MVNSGLQIREQSYRSASRAFDYLIVGLSSILFLATAFFFDIGQTPVSGVLGTAAIVLFALAVITGLKKLEYFVAILGADYSIALTEGSPHNLTVRETTVVVRDLKETVEQLSNKASVAHSLRNWFLMIGILTVIAWRVLSVVQTS